MTRRFEFSPTTCRQEYDRAKGKCRACGAALQLGRIQYDHLLPCALGGDNSLANCRVLCTPCHAAKTAKEDVPRIRKADRQKARAIGAKQPKGDIRSPGFQRPEPQKRASKPIAKIDGLPSRQLFRETAK